MSVLCMQACTPRTGDTSGYENLPEDGWRYGDTLKYCPRMDDSIASGTLMVAVRHDNSYPYSDLYLEVSYPASPTDTSDQRLRRDTIRMALADPYGRWTGQGFGASYQNSTNVGHRITLRDSSTVYLRHVMRTDTLRGIVQAGIIFTADDVSK